LSLSFYLEGSYRIVASAVRYLLEATIAYFWDVGLLYERNFISLCQMYYSLSAHIFHLPCYILNVFCCDCRNKFINITKLCLNDIQEFSSYRKGNTTCLYCKDRSVNSLKVYNSSLRIIWNS
jgi:hypothetical protein